MLECTTGDVECLTFDFCYMHIGREESEERQLEFNSILEISSLKHFNWVDDENFSLALLVLFSCNKGPRYHVIE